MRNDAPLRVSRYPISRNPGHRVFRSTLLVALLTCFSFSLVHASILVAPTRLTFEPGERVQQVTVVNNGTQAVTLRISFVNYHMRADGSFVEATKPLQGEHFADDFLQYAPRRIHLKPGEGQAVRVLARPPADSATEYRSHLRFQTEPSTSPNGESRQGNSDSKGGVKIQLIPLYAVSIPLIVRTGELSATAHMNGLTVQRGPDGQSTASFRLHRSGNRSIYGDVRLYLIPRGGEKRLVGETRGLAIYPPLTSRQVHVPFNKLRTATLPPGTLRIEYVDHDSPSRVLAVAERNVP